MRQKWSDLSKTDQESIINRIIDNNEDSDPIAIQYNLKPSSLSRTMRRIKARRNMQAANELRIHVGDKLETDSYYVGKDTVGISMSNSPFMTLTPITSISRITPYNKKDLEIAISGDTESGSNPNDRTMFINSNKVLKILMFTDTHFPFHDSRAIDCFLRAAELLPHDIIINGGDTLDIYGLSKYGKDPSLAFSKNLKQECRDWRAFATKLNAISPDSEKFNIFGNHMERYITWLHNNQSVMHMDEMQIDSLMKLDQLAWHINVGEILINGNYLDLDFPNPELIIHHGTNARKNAGSSSRTESENLGYVSSITGHVHRLSVSYKRTLSGQVIMAEGGTLRDLHPDYLHRPDWQNGFLYITHVPGVATYCQPILIHNGQAFYEGKLI